MLFRSDLLIANCDEFIYYEDIVRNTARRKPAKKKSASKKSNGDASGASSKGKVDKAEERAQSAFNHVLETLDDIVSERGEESQIWGSMVKQALKRRKPSFSESYHGFRSFGKLLEEMGKRKLLTLQHDEKSGGYLITAHESD